MFQVVVLFENCPLKGKKIKIKIKSGHWKKILVLYSNVQNKRNKTTFHVLFRPSRLSFRGLVSVFRGRVQNVLLGWQIPKFSSDFQSLVLKKLLRTGALHPMPNLSGCKCTRCTRTNEAPDVCDDLLPSYPAFGPFRPSEAVMAVACKMKVMWRAVSTTFTFRQQRLAHRAFSLKLLRKERKKTKERLAKR